MRKRVIGNDFLGLNRSTPVRVIESDGVLYIDHETDAAAPEVGYKDNILLDFAGAYYPIDLIRFMERYGTLFNIDTQDVIGLPEGAESVAPTEEAMRAALAPLAYPDGKKRLVSQSIKRIRSECLERDTGHAWFINQREYFGDWVAARAVFQVALQLLGGESAGGRKGTCPDFRVSLESAPRYRAFLESATKGHHWTFAAHGTDGTTEEEQGVFLDGDCLVCHCPKHNVDTAVSLLASVHTSNAVVIGCKDLQLVERYKSLLQVIWCQLPEQLGERVVIEHCENPRCGNVMLRLRRDEKHACCDSCQQALKEGR